MNTSAQIKARFPYMFAGPLDDDGITFQRGWMPILERLCQDIDALLGADKHGFHWTHIGYGYRDELDHLHFYWHVDATEDLQLAIQHRVAMASEQSTRTCVVCATPGQVHASVTSEVGEILTLCDGHAQELRQRGIEGTGGRSWYELKFEEVES
jgi:hypothetical protein